MHNLLQVVNMQEYKNVRNIIDYLIRLCLHDTGTKLCRYQIITVGNCSHGTSIISCRYGVAFTPCQIFRYGFTSLLLALRFRVISCQLFCYGFIWYRYWYHVNRVLWPWLYHLFYFYTQKRTTCCKLSTWRREQSCATNWEQYCVGNCEQCCAATHEQCCQQGCSAMKKQCCYNIVFNHQYCYNL